MVAGLLTMFRLHVRTRKKSRMGRTPQLLQNRKLLEIDGDVCKRVISNFVDTDTGRRENGGGPILFLVVETEHIKCIEFDENLIELMHFQNGQCL